MKNETTAEMILLLDGSFTVPQKFYNKIREQVTDIVPALVPDVEYTMKLLCGPEYWDSLTNGERQSAGKCMVYMVKNELIPYSNACKSCQSPKVYTIIR